jgi:hypothetical protein
MSKVAEFRFEPHLGCVDVWPTLVDTYVPDWRSEDASCILVSYLRSSMVPGMKLSAFWAQRVARRGEETSRLVAA